MNAFKYNCIPILLFMSIASKNSLAETCNVQTCNGYDMPESAKHFIAEGYSFIKIDMLQNKHFLFLSSDGDVNKCSVLFEIENNKINKEPFIGQDGEFCNVTQDGDSVLSSWRDRGVWNSNVYRMNSVGKLELFINDSCADCQQVKRTYFKEGGIIKKALLSEGDRYLARKELEGYIKKLKAPLYKGPDEKQKTKAYLVKGDSFSLTDMSDDGLFYEIEYKRSSGNSKQYWIKSDDFEVKK